MLIVDSLGWSFEAGHFSLDFHGLFLLTLLWTASTVPFSLPEAPPGFFLNPFRDFALFFRCC